MHDNAAQFSPRLVHSFHSPTFEIWVSLILPKFVPEFSVTRLIWFLATTLPTFLKKFAWSTHARTRGRGRPFFHLYISNSRPETNERAAPSCVRILPGNPLFKSLAESTGKCCPLLSMNLYEPWMRQYSGKLPRIFVQNFSEVCTLQRVYWQQVESAFRTKLGSISTPIVIRHVKHPTSKQCLGQNYAASPPGSNLKSDEPSERKSWTKLGSISPCF